MAEEVDENGDVGEDGCDAAVEDVRGASNADVGDLFFVSNTADVGDRSSNGVEYIECVIKSDG